MIKTWQAFLVTAALLAAVVIALGRRNPVPALPLLAAPSIRYEAEAARIQAETEAWKALTAELKELATQTKLAAPEAREWLTLDEAAEYSGLPAASIAELLKSGSSPISFMGRGQKTWRIQRVSLDAYGKAAH